MKERSLSSVSAYRYGFNGKEMDKNIQGSDYDYGMRIYDPRMGRFLSVDPLFKKFTYYSPFQFASNNPNLAVDLDGMESSDDKNSTTYTIKKGDSYAKIASASKGKLTVQDLINLNPGIDPKKLQIGQQINVSGSTLDLSGNIKMVEPGVRKLLNTDQVAEGINQDLQESGSDAIVTEISFEPDEVGIGDAGALGSAIPLYGSGRNAINDFQNGRYISGSFNLIMAASDLMLVKSIYEGISKGGFEAFKLGNKPWKGSGGYRSFYGQSGFAEPFQDIHHWAFEQNGAIGKSLPNGIKNQMWNLLPMEGATINGTFYNGTIIHQAIHGNSSILTLNTAQKIWYGTPNWVKAAAVSYGGRATKGGFGMVFNF